MPFLAPIGVAGAAAAASASAASTAATVASIVGATAAVAGTGLAFYGQQAQASYQKKAAQQQAEFQRAMGARNAALVDIEGRAAEDALRRDRVRRLSALRAAQGASGISGGSPLDLYADNAAQASRDLSYLGFETARRRQEAVLGGQVATRRELLGGISADFDKVGSYGTLIGGFGQAAGLAAGAFGA